MRAVTCGEVSLEEAAVQVSQSTGGIAQLQHATLDLDRERRRGFPEVIYCASKTPEQIAAIARGLLRHHGMAFGTRCTPETARAVSAQLDGVHYHSASATLLAGTPRTPWTNVKTAVIAAGTSDLPVAEEACATLETFGAPAERIYDVGVAGLHRLAARQDQINACGVLIVVAGMEGALPGVVAGLSHQPVIGVPTSVGYGAALGGFTALLAMLTSCSGGLTVVNIDNGFGAALAALSILKAINHNKDNNT